MIEVDVLRQEVAVCCDARPAGAQPCRLTGPELAALFHLLPVDSPGPVLEFKGWAQHLLIWRCAMTALAERAQLRQFWVLIAAGMASADSPTGYQGHRSHRIGSQRRGLGNAQSGAVAWPYGR